MIPPIASGLRDARVVETTAPQPPARASRLGRALSWGAFAALLTVAVAHLAGRSHGLLFPLVTFSAFAAPLIGMRLHRAEVRWPWWAFSAAAVLWTVSAIVEEVVGPHSALGSDRSLLPDVFALPAYLCVGVALRGLIRARATSREHTALLDGWILGAAFGLVVWQAVIDPTLQIAGASLPAQLIVIVYPVLSVMLLISAARLAFAPGEQSPAFVFVLAGVFFLHLGDLVYALGVIGRIDSRLPLAELPYLMAPAFYSAGALHPTMSGVTTSAPRSWVRVSLFRALAVSSALAAPLGVLAVGIESRSDAITVLLCAVVVAAGIVRTIHAMRHHAIAAEHMYYRATHDDLTGLPGRSLLEQQIDELFDAESDDVVSLMFVDLDRFKPVNDSMGHAAGDRLLVLVADRMLEAVGTSGVVYRLSGDEFVVLASSLDDAEIEAIASRIRQTIRTPFELLGTEVYLSASVGYTTAPACDHDLLLSIIADADEAMFRSKQHGRDATTRFDVEMKRRTERRIELERQLRHSLERGDLVVHYQPIVAGASWVLTGFEALTRWTTAGVSVPPDEFIAIAEESGLIVPLGEFVLDEACRQLARWRKEQPSVARCTVAVNVSARQLLSGDIVETVRDALCRHDLPGDALWLEITESVLIEDVVTTAAVLAAMQGLGVRVSIDDFGTGFSSLSHLKRLPLAGVKIDRSFVDGVCDDPSDRSLVEAVIAMADALGLELVAEGVERPEQALLLRELGCQKMQGFLFGRAELPSAISQLIAIGADEHSLAERVADTGCDHATGQRRRR